MFTVFLAGLYPPLGVSLEMLFKLSKAPWTVGTVAHSWI
jgi:hypothetical protein